MIREDAIRTHPSRTNCGRKERGAWKAAPRNVKTLHSEMIKTKMCQSTQRPLKMCVYLKKPNRDAPMHLKSSGFCSC